MGFETAPACCLFDFCLLRFALLFMPMNQNGDAHGQDI